MTTARRWLPALVLLTLLGGCGGGDSTSEQTTEVAQEATDTEQYCSLSLQLDAQDGPPSEEQLAELEEAAPAEIADDVATLAEAVRNEDFDDPAVGEAESRLLAWEEENCQ